MMKKLREVLLARDKRAVIYIAMLAGLGILLLALGNGMFFNKPEDAAAVLPGFGGTAEDFPAVDPGEASNETVSSGGGAFFVREREMEQRLEEAFAMMQDVGKVRVVVSLSPDRETVYATDTNQTDSVTRETDSQGGVRETRNQSKQEETIMYADGSKPLVLREIGQKIEGALIIAEGGDNVFVKDALTKAACTLLGVEANKVQVLKMKI